MAISLLHTARPLHTVSSTPHLSDTNEEIPEASPLPLKAVERHVLLDCGQKEGPLDLEQRSRTIRERDHLLLPSQQLVSWVTKTKHLSSSRSSVNARERHVCVGVRPSVALTYIAMIPSLQISTIKSTCFLSSTFGISRPNEISRQRSGRYASIFGTFLNWLV